MPLQAYNINASVSIGLQAKAAQKLHFRHNLIQIYFTSRNIIEKIIQEDQIHPLPVESTCDIIEREMQYIFIYESYTPEVIDYVQ